MGAPEVIIGEDFHIEGVIAISMFMRKNRRINQLTIAEGAG
jgi:hypothetical protein